MKLTPSIVKAISETKYLSVDNHARYRLIMRLFYINHERINYWLNANEVYDEVSEHISDYTIDDCRADLENLADWGNLINDIDTANIFKLQDFKSKKFRYQMSDYAVEIERLTVKLENMNIEGGSLDIGLIGSIRVGVEQMKGILRSADTELYSWWRSLGENFARLNREYQDYMKCFSFLKNEDSATARRFIYIKDDIIKYLRSFVKGVQRDGAAIARELADCESIKNDILERVISYEYSIPRLNGEVSKDDIEDEVYSKYNNLYRWFTSSDGAGMEHILSITNNVIRSLTGYAAILAENISSAASRREEYRTFAKMFAECACTEDAHKLSSLIFGLTNTCHIAADDERITESITSGIYDEPPVELIIKPRVNTYREKQKQSEIRDKSAEKKRQLAEHIRAAEKQRADIEKLIRGGKIIMEELPVISSETRLILLSWISCAASRDYRFRTEYGHNFVLIPPADGRSFELKCEDGDLFMPAFILDFGGGI